MEYEERHNGFSPTITGGIREKQDSRIPLVFQACGTTRGGEDQMSGMCEGDKDDLCEASSLVISNDYSTP